MEMNAVDSGLMWAELSHHLLLINLERCPLHSPHCFASDSSERLFQMKRLPMAEQCVNFSVVCFYLRGRVGVVPLISVRTINPNWEELIWVANPPNNSDERLKERIVIFIFCNLEAIVSFVLLVVVDFIQILGDSVWQAIYRQCQRMDSEMDRFGSVFKRCCWFWSERWSRHLPSRHFCPRPIHPNLLDIDKWLHKRVIIGPHPRDSIHYDWNKSTISRTMVSWSQFADSFKSNGYGNQPLREPSSDSDSSISSSISFWIDFESVFDAIWVSVLPSFPRFLLGSVQHIRCNYLVAYYINSYKTRYVFMATVFCWQRGFPILFVYWEAARCYSGGCIDPTATSASTQTLVVAGWGCFVKARRIRNLKGRLDQAFSETRRGRRRRRREEKTCRKRRSSDSSSGSSSSKRRRRRGWWWRRKKKRGRGRQKMEKIYLYVYIFFFDKKNHQPLMLSFIFFMLLHWMFCKEIFAKIFVYLYFGFWTVQVASRVLPFPSEAFNVPTSWLDWISFDWIFSCVMFDTSRELFHLTFWLGTGVAELQMMNYLIGLIYFIVMMLRSMNIIFISRLFFYRFSYIGLIYWLFEIWTLLGVSPAECWCL